MLINRRAGSDVWHSNVECAAIKMEREGKWKLEEREVTVGEMEAVEGTLCLCARTALMTTSTSPEAVAALYVSDELAALGALAVPDWEALGHLVACGADPDVDTPAELSMAFESVRALWNAIEGGSVTRKRLALALEKSSYIAEREAFCDLLVTTEAVEEMARTWGKWYWTDNVTKAWMYKMVDYTNDDEVRLSMMEEFAHGTVLTALTSTITEMMFALLERMMPICAKRDRVVLVMQPAEFLKEHSDKHVAWDLLGRYLVGFYGGRGVMVMPGFEFLTNENKLTDKQNRSSGLLGTKLMLDFGTLSANCPIEFDCGAKQLSSELARLVRVLEAANVLWNDADGPRYSAYDYERRHIRPKDPLMVPAEAMRVAAAALS